MARRRPNRRTSEKLQLRSAPFSAQLLVSLHKRTIPFAKKSSREKSEKKLPGNARPFFEQPIDQVYFRPCFLAIIFFFKQNIL